MTDGSNSVVFATVVRSHYGLSSARLLIRGLRAFGGDLCRAPFWIFQADENLSFDASLLDGTTQIIPLKVPEAIQGYPFAEKVYACAEAEQLAGPEFGSLIWIDPGCLVTNPPTLFALDASADAAVRPVHLQIVGLLAEQPLDSFWKKIYETVGVKDIHATVESFVDRKRIRAYFNSHAYSVNPSLGLMQDWYGGFSELVTDRDFQEKACQDDLHKIFLFQALLSALLVTRLDPRRIRILPPEYNYPYNLQQDLPDERRSESLNELVCIAYEDRSLDPDQMYDISVSEPLRSWLADHTRSAIDQ